MTISDEGRHSHEDVGPTKRYIVHDFEEFDGDFLSN